jgi:tetratricopeptide (TPR) repeat protein
LDEAEKAIRRARDLDPLSPPINTSLGLVYFVGARYDDAESCLKRALEIDPDFDLAHWWLGAIYLNRAMLPHAFRALRKTGVLSNSRFRDAGKFSAGARRNAHPGKTQRLLHALTSVREYVSPLLVAAVHASAGSNDAALEWLRRAVNEHDPWVAWLGVDRRFDGLRSDARFLNMLNEIGVDQALRTSAAI